MSDKFFDQILLSLKEGDVIYIKEMHDLPKSKMRITDIFEDGVGGYVIFEGEEEIEEYGELYGDDYEFIYHVEIA